MTGTDRAWWEARGVQKRRIFTARDIAAIALLREQGKTMRDIAAIVGSSASSVCRALARFEEAVASAAGTVPKRRRGKP